MSIFKGLTRKDVSNPRFIQNDTKSLVHIPETDVQVKQTEALITLATGINTIANFLTSGGLTDLVSANAKSRIVSDILGGLAAHNGRNSLDAQTIKQNSLEIVETIEAVWSKYQERAKAKDRDPEIHDAEKDFKKSEEK